MKTRKLKRILLNPLVIGNLFTNGNKYLLVENGLPESAIFRGVALDPLSGLWNVFFEDTSFEEIEHFEEVPVLTSVCSLVVNGDM